MAHRGERVVRAPGTSIRSGRAPKRFMCAPTTACSGAPGPPFTASGSTMQPSSVTVPAGVPHFAWFNAGCCHIATSVGARHCVAPVSGWKCRVLSFSPAFGAPTLSGAPGKREKSLVPRAAYAMPRETWWPVALLPSRRRVKQRGASDEFFDHTTNSSWSTIPRDEGQNARPIHQSHPGIALRLLQNRSG
jgi:hypothetical protein